MALCALFCAVFLGSGAVADPVKRPNILFAIADDMSHASAYGYEFVSTPHFDAIAAEGLLFERMYTPSSKCAPSRAVLLTGRNPWQLEGAGNHKPVWPLKFKSVVEALEDHGYFAGFTGKGWNPGIHPKGRQLTGKAYNSLEVESKLTKAIAAFDYSANFKQFMADKPEGQPFFFWYGAKEPHRGYEFKSGQRLGKTFGDLDFIPPFWPEEDAVKHDILDYAIEVEYFDRHLGEILAHLEELGELENTLIIATSDNGMPFPRYKGHPHEFATRIPFVVKWSGRIESPGRRCVEFASFTDLAPTFLEAAGVAEDEAAMQPIEGRSLSDFFANEVDGREHVLTGRERNDMCRPHGWGYPVRSLHHGDLVYMHNFEPDRWPSGTPESLYRDTDWSPTKMNILEQHHDTAFYRFSFGKRPQEELYDITVDPFCLHNLASDPAYSAKREEMKQALFAELKTQGDPRLNGDPDFFDRSRPERIPDYDELVEKYKHITSELP